MRINDNINENHIPIALGGVYQSKKTKDYYILAHSIKNENVTFYYLINLRNGYYSKCYRSLKYLKSDLTLNKFDFIDASRVNLIIKQ